jgi:peptidoglycan/LPS O-acetylase OafA/YrhL
MNSSSNYINSLTALRGIAALLVVVFHFHLLIMPLADQEATLLIRRLYLMVDLFFILSGFIMMYVYGEWFSDTLEYPSYRKYLTARFARIYPLHFLTFLYVLLLFSILWYHHVPLDSTTQAVGNKNDIPLHLFMLHGLRMPASGTWNTPSWSIGAEWLMYLIFPVLVRPFNKLHASGMIVCVAIASLLYYFTPDRNVVEGYEQFRLPMKNLDNIAFPANLMRCIAGFLLGMVIYKLYTQKLGAGFFNTGYSGAVCAVLMVCLLHLSLPDFITIWTFPILILAVAHNDVVEKSILKSKPLQFLGDISYSVYLVHIPIIFTLMVYKMIQPAAAKDPMAAQAPNYLVGWIACLIFLSLVIGLATLLYRYYELPWRKTINQWVKK